MTERSELIGQNVDSVRKGLLSALEAKGFAVTRETRAKGEGGQGYVEELTHDGQQVLTTLMPVDPDTTAVLQTWSGVRKEKEAKR